MTGALSVTMNPSTAKPAVVDRQHRARCVRIGTVWVDLATHTVLREGVGELRLSPKAAQVLLVLLDHGDRPVHREALIARAWPGQFRTDDVVTKAMQELRRALSNGPDQPAIETIPRVGYRLLLPVEWLEDPAAAPFRDDSQAPPPRASSAEPSATAMAATTQTGLMTGGSRRTRGMVIAAAASLATLALIAGIQRGDGATQARPRAPSTPSFSTTSVAPRLDATPLATDPGDDSYPALSPDGALLAIAVRELGASRYRLHLRDVAGGGDRLLLSSGSGDEIAPSWSPDGKTLAYYRVDGDVCTLEVTGIFGFDQRPLLNCVASLIAPAEFLPDGGALLLPWLAIAGQSRNAGFARVDLTTAQSSDYDLGAPAPGLELEARFSPDGRRLLVHRGSAPFATLTLFDLDRQHPRAPLEFGERFNSIRGITWLPDNRHAVLAGDGAGAMELWRIDTVSAAVERFGGLVGRYPSAARRAELLVYSRQERATELRELTVARGAGAVRHEALFASTRAESAPAIAADGVHLAFVSDRRGEAQIYLGNLSGDAPKAITQFKSGRPFDLSFSSDGRQLAFGLMLDGQTQALILELASGKLSEVQLGIARSIDLRFGDRPGQLLFTAWDEDGRPHVYTQQQDQPASARPLSSCVGRAARAGGDGWVYFFAPDQRMLKRVRGDAVDGDCEAVSDRVRWFNRHAWIADPAGPIAVLTPLNRVERAGLYRLSEPPQLLLELPDLARQPLGNIELVGSAGRIIAALPVAANADVWLVRGAPAADADHAD